MNPSSSENPESMAVAVDNNCVANLASVRKSYGDLIKKFAIQLQINSVSFEEMASLAEQELRIDLNSPEFQQNGARLNNNCDLLYHLRTKGYMPFYSLGFLKTIIQRFALESDKLLKEYETKHLRPYLRKSLSEIGEECFDHERVADQLKLSIKIDRQWDTTRLLDVIKLTKEVSSIIDIPHKQLVIEKIEHGCVQVVYRIPRASAVKDLTRSQKQRLRDMSVMQMVCDGTTLLTDTLVEEAPELGQTLYMLSLCTQLHSVTVESQPNRFTKEYQTEYKRKKVKYPRSEQASQRTTPTEIRQKGYKVFNKRSPSARSHPARTRHYYKQCVPPVKPRARRRSRHDKQGHDMCHVTKLDRKMLQRWNGWAQKLCCSDSHVVK